MTAPLIHLWPGNETAPERRFPWAQLILLISIAFVLRVISLNQQLWFDEITTLLSFVRVPFSEVITTYTSENQHFLFSILAWISTHTFGDHPWTLRLPSVLFGVLSIPALFLFGRQLTNRSEALWASALMTVSYHHVWFSQNARGYTGVLFFALLGSWLFIRAARQHGWTLWVWYGVVIALGMYTHLSMGFIAAGHGLVYVWLLLARWSSLRQPRVLLQPLLGFLAALVFTLLLYSLVLPQLFARIANPIPGSTQSEWKNPLWLLGETLRGLSAGAGTLGLGAVAIASLIALLGLISYWRQDRYALGLLLLSGVATMVGLLATRHNLWPRMFFFGIGFGFLVLVRGLFVASEEATRRFAISEGAGSSLRRALLAMVFVASAWMLRSAYLYPKQDFVGAMQAVEAARQPGELVVTVGLTTLPYRDYYHRDWHAVETAAALEALRARGSRVWLVYTFPIHLRAKYPEIWHIIQSEFAIVRVFRGTIGDGEIVLCQSRKQ